MKKSQYIVALELIRNEENWCTGTMVEGHKGDNQICCLLGACAIANGLSYQDMISDEVGYNPQTYPELWDYVRNKYNQSPYSFNDTHTHPEVIEMFQAFINTLQEDSE